MNIPRPPMPFEIWNPALGFSRFMSGEEFFRRFLPSLISLFFVIGSIVFLFILLINGIRLVTSGGDKVAYEESRRGVSNALIGLLVMFSVFAVLNLIEIFFGIDLTLIDINAIKL